MKQYELSHQKNIRDLGGLVGDNGRTIKYGLLYRGGSLHKMTPEDIEVVKSFHLTDVIDFRSKEEFATRPDIRIPGVNYHNFTTFEHELKTEHREHDDGNLLWFMDRGTTGHEHLVRTYKELVDTEEGQEAYRNLFKIIMKKGSVTYFHCSQGKDRVGVAAYLIEAGLGVSMDQIIDDYLLSNVAMDKRIGILVEGVKDKSFYNDEYHQSLLEVFSAKMAYLQEAIDIIDEKYGGVISYLNNVLQVDIKKFREMYLE